MSLEQELTAAFVDGYRIAGQVTGYWGRRFLQAVNRNGGLATAQRMLKPRTAMQRKGLDSLLEHGRPDLSVGAIVLQPQFRSLFTAAELEVAAARLGEYGRKAQALAASRERLFPDELEPGHIYTEGARRQVRVNAYERDAKARKACIAHHGDACSVCGFIFGARYGTHGKGFIHVHHLKPLSLSDGEYVLNPISDLRPVCPNCHAMLHRGTEVLTIERLRALLKHGDG